MKLSRKDKKARADKKRLLYKRQMVDHADHLLKYYNKDTFAYQMEQYVINLIDQNHLEAHLIRQSARQFARQFHEAVKRLNKT